MFHTVEELKLGIHRGGQPFILGDHDQGRHHEFEGGGGSMHWKVEGSNQIQ